MVTQPRKSPKTSHLRKVVLLKSCQKRPDIDLTRKVKMAWYFTVTVTIFTYIIELILTRQYTVHHCHMTIHGNKRTREINGALYLQWTVPRDSFIFANKSPEKKRVLANLMTYREVAWHTETFCSGEGNPKLMQHLHVRNTDTARTRRHHIRWVSLKQHCCLLGVQPHN